MTLHRPQSNETVFLATIPSETQVAARDALQLECVREAESDRAKLPDRVDHRLDGWLESATVNSRERCTTNRLK